MSTKNSPEYIRISLAAAMTLGLRRGLFWRDAKLYCINLLTVYEHPCAGNCAYCGLHNRRMAPKNPPLETRKTKRGDKTFIRVEWPTYTTDLVVEKIVEKENVVPIKRVCISMITRAECVDDSIEIARRIRSKSSVPISMLIAPTVVRKDDLPKIKDAGADKIGVAIDAATPEIFDKFRGKGQNAPHKWDTYWERFKQAIDIFGKGNVGSHLIVGLGETEREMALLIQKIKDLGGETHLFSFCPEEGSDLQEKSPPPIAQYRRVQIARYLIDNGIFNAEKFEYNERGEITDFGIPEEELDKVISSGLPFMTSGCVGRDGQVACNRPYANTRPGPRIRNYPFIPDENDIRLIKAQLETGIETFAEI